MTDFRIELPSEPLSDVNRELDWDQQGLRWTRSEREYGDVRWDQNLQPAAADLDYLRTFFYLTGDIDGSTLASMSPGELAQLHAAQEAGPPKVVATLCPDCGAHWIVDRSEGADGPWRRYGRTCNYRWIRGQVVESPPQSSPTY